MHVLIVQIHDLQALKVIGSVSSKKRLFQELGDLLGSCYKLPANRVAEALQTTLPVVASII